MKKFRLVLASLLLAATLVSRQLESTQSAVMPQTVAWTDPIEDLAPKQGEQTSQWTDPIEDGAPVTQWTDPIEDVAPKQGNPAPQWTDPIED